MEVRADDGRCNGVGQRVTEVLGARATVSRGDGHPERRINHAHSAAIDLNLEGGHGHRTSLEANRSRVNFSSVSEGAKELHCALEQLVVLYRDALLYSEAVASVVGRSPHDRADADRELGRPRGGGRAIRQSGDAGDRRRNVAVVGRVQVRQRDHGADQRASVGGHTHDFRKDRKGRVHAVQDDRGKVDQRDHRRRVAIEDADIVGGGVDGIEAHHFRNLAGRCARLDTEVHDGDIGAVSSVGQVLRRSRDDAELKRAYRCCFNNEQRERASRRVDGVRNHDLEQRSLVEKFELSAEDLGRCITSGRRDTEVHDDIEELAGAQGDVVGNQRQGHRARGIGGATEARGDNRRKRQMTRGVRGKRAQ